MQARRRFVESEYAAPLFQVCNSFEAIRGVLFSESEYAAPLFQVGPFSDGDVSTNALFLRKALPL